MTSGRLRLWLVGLVWSVGIAAAPASGSTTIPAQWPVSGEAWGKIKRNGGHEPSEDVSGLACAPEAAGRRLCLLVDDESQGAQIVIVRGGRLVIGDYLPLATTTHAGKPIELDAEAVAHAAGAFYIAGSHGRPRHEADPEEEAENQAKARSSKHLVRLRFSPGAVDLETGRLLDRGKVDTAVSTRLPALLSSHPPLKAALDTPLEDNGLTIEGLAVAGGRLIVGFRGPAANTEAFLLSAPEASLFEAGEDPGQLIRIAIGRDASGRVRGVRDLLAVGDRLVGLAGPVNDPPEGVSIQCGDYAAFEWSPSGGVRLQEMELYGAASDPPTKPEGLALLSEGTDRLAALVVFDGPPNGRPTPLELSFMGPSRCALPGGTSP